MSLQITALEESIVHWEENFVRATNKELLRLAASNCPCCRIWFKEHCAGCPISEYTGVTNCHRTPYRDIQSCYPYPGMKKDVQEELDFLKKVLTRWRAF